MYVDEIGDIYFDPNKNLCHQIKIKFVLTLIRFSPMLTYSRVRSACLESPFRVIIEFFLRNMFDPIRFGKVPLLLFSLHSAKVLKSMHQENECKQSSIGYACLMPEFTKVWSVANIALIKLTARSFMDEVLQSRVYVYRLDR